MSLLTSLFEFSKPDRIIKSIIFILLSKVDFWILNDGKFDPLEFSENVSLAIFSAFIDSFLPCSIWVVLFASKIFNWLIFLFFKISILFKSTSVKNFKNLITSLSSVFLQNCQ